MSPEAHDLYLRGLALFQGRTEQGLWDAVADFEKAAALAPDFAPAYAGLGLTYSILADYTTRISYEESYRRSRDAAERALALDPTLPEPFAALGIMTFYRGNKETGLALLQRASELGPRSAIVANNYGWFLIAAERTADAIAVCGRVLSAVGDTPLCLEIDALARVIQDGPEAARDSFERWARVAGNTSDPDRVVDLLGALEGRNDRRAVAERLAATPVHSEWVGTGMMFQATDVPILLMLLDAPDLALAYIERTSGDPMNYTDWAMVIPALDPLRCDPRFRAVGERIGYVDGRAAKVCAGTR